MPIAVMLSISRPTLLPEGNPYSDFDPSEYFVGHDPARKVELASVWLGRRKRSSAQPGRMLELGCGRGELLCGAARRGWVVAGVDMTPGFVAEARSAFGVEVEEAPVETCQSLDRTWDAILLAAVLEHVYEPMALLQVGSRSLCAPEGRCSSTSRTSARSTLDSGTSTMRLRGRDWALNLSPTFAPFHVVGFCPKSLRYALGDARGLEVVAMDPLRP